VLEVLAANDLEVAQRVSGKLVEAYLRTPAPEKAILFIMESGPKKLRDALIAQLLDYIRQTGVSSRLMAIGLLDKVVQTVPDRFGPDWARQFDELRVSLTPATQPVASRPE